jgi:putative lipoic acid-binding regulatory protein
MLEITRVLKTQQDEEDLEDENDDAQRSSVDNYTGVSIKVRPLFLCG